MSDVEPTVRLVRSLCLKHRLGMGEDTEEVDLAAGTELEVVRDWGEHLLVKDEWGRRFTVAKSETSR